MNHPHDDQEDIATQRPEKRGTTAPTLLTVTQFCQQHRAFPVGGIRWLLFHRQENGLDRAVVKVGRRVLIDVDKFFAWIDEQNSA